MVRVASPSEILVVDPFRLPDVEDSLAVVVRRLFAFRILDAERIRIIETLPPCLHQDLHPCNGRTMLRGSREVLHLVQIGREIEQQLVVASRVSHRPSSIEACSPVGSSSAVLSSALLDSQHKRHR